MTSFPIKWDENQPEEYPPEQEQLEVEETDLLPLEDIVDEEEKQEEEEEEVCYWFTRLVVIESHVIESAL